jgi:translation initiation factor 1 (eIF-1/SUI1)
MDSTEDIFRQIDKRITIRFLKEKRTTRTYIEGLEDFISEEQINDLIKKIKKLGTSYLKRTDEDIEDDKKTKTKKSSTPYIAHGFNGDHKTKIIKFLTEDYNIPKEKIHSTS